MTRVIREIIEHELGRQSTSLYARPLAPPSVSPVITRNPGDTPPIAPWRNTSSAGYAEWRSRMFGEFPPQSPPAVSYRSTPSTTLSPLHAAWEASVNTSTGGISFPFAYHRAATLMASIQHAETGEYYDFATKLFAAKPQHPRAAMLAIELPAGRNYLPNLYGLTVGRSARLHGTYVITVRDADQPDVIVAVLQHGVEDNRLAGTVAAPLLLAHYNPEAGLPDPAARPPAPVDNRSGRGVDLG